MTILLVSTFAQTADPSPIRLAVEWGAAQVDAGSNDEIVS